MDQVEYQERPETVTHGNGRTPIGRLLRELRDDMVTLVRQESELGRTEVGEKLARVLRNAVYLTAGLFVALLGLIYVVQGASILLTAALIDAGWAAVTAAWAAPAIVGGVVALIGVLLAAKGYATLKDESVVPQRTVHTIKEDLRWAQRKAS